jgi:class 3 adenylate cyclase
VSEAGDDAAFSRDIVCVCGAVSPVTARFCASCGRPLAGSSAGAAAPSAPRTEQYGRRSFGPEDSAGVTIPHSRSVEERRRVTALFADVSGFTSLAGRLDTEELLAVVDPVIAGLAEIVDRYDGYLEKFAGDALLALFGAPVAHEDDAVRALRVAAEMHASIAALSTSPAAAGLSLHVGVNTGVPGPSRPAGGPSTRCSVSR